MLRGASNHYVGLTNEPTAVFSPDGTIEFVGSDGDTSRVQKKPSVRMSKKAAAFLFLCIIVFILAISTANFIILMQNRTKISYNYNSIKELPDQLRLKPEELNASVQNALANWSDNVMSRLREELRIRPEQIDDAVEQALAKWSTDNIPRLKAELHITPELLDGKIEMSLANLSENILNRLKDELEISPSQVEAGIQRVMANMSERALAMLKGVCDITYRDKCYWAVKSGAVQFQHAASLCHNHGAEAADITSEEQFQEMLTYLRAKMPPLKTVWLGMTRNITGGKNYMENGDILNYTLSWFPNYPFRRRAYTHIGLHFEKDVSAIRQGFFNDYASSFRHGILCEL